MPYERQTYCANGHEFTPENVYVATHRSDGHQYRQCRTCHREDDRRRRAERAATMTPEELAEWRNKFPSRQKMKHYQRKYKYGMTEQEVRDLVESQGNGCAICEHAIRVDATEWDDQVHIDHDHETGLVRAALCRRCNAGLGFFREDAAVIARAATYIRQNNETKGVA